MTSKLALFSGSVLDQSKETVLSAPNASIPITVTAPASNGLAPPASPSTPASRPASARSSMSASPSTPSMGTPPSPPISHSPTMDSISSNASSIPRYSRSEENLAAITPGRPGSGTQASRPSSNVSTPSEHRWSNNADDSELEEEKEEDAEDACKWLVFSGFPQYVQLYKENVPCDPDQVKFDHEFLTESQLQAVTKRLLILNSGLSRRASKRVAKTIAEEDESRSRSNSQADGAASKQRGAEDGETDEGDKGDSDIGVTRFVRRQHQYRRGMSRENLETTAVRGLGDSSDMLGDSAPNADTLEEPQPVLSSKWTYRSDSKKYSRSFRENRRSSDTPLESITFAKVYANKWSNFVRQKSIKHSSSDAASVQEKSLFTLTCREILVVQSLSLLSLTNMLDQRHGADASANKKFQKKVMHDLTKLLQPNKKVEYNAVGIFGVPLQTILERTGQPLPAVIYDAMNYLFTSCLEIEGLFRKAGSATRTRELREKCEKGGEIEFANIPPHDVADLVKQYFRDLPEPLLTTQLSEIFLEAERSPTAAQKTQMLQHIIPLLPDENREVLQVLLNLLATIAKHSQTSEAVKGNQMDANNLALVFAPNIFYTPPAKAKNTFSRESKDAAMKEVQNQETASNCLRHMIEHMNDVFMTPEEIYMQVSFIATDRAPWPGLQHLYGPDYRDYFASFMQKQVDGLLADVNDKFKSFFLYVRKDGIRIAYKRAEEEMLQTWCGQAIVNSTPERVLERIAYQRYLWDPDVQTERLVEEVDKETDIFYYTRRGRGPIPGRDYCLMRTKRNLGNGKCLMVCFSIRHPSAPENPGIVRTQVYVNQFYIEKNDTATSRITYISQVDLKGRTPNWYNKAAGVHDIMVLADIRKVLDMQQLPGPETCV